MGKQEEEEEQVLLVFKLNLGDYSIGSSSFDLEKAVCSHGLFMMAPNVWDPSTKTLQRPLRLSSNPTASVNVRISSSSSSSSSCSLHVHVFSQRTHSHSHSLSQEDEQFLLAQVARMLRLSENEERNIQGFYKIHPQAKERCFGRVFRSPTLFEDMVKCILLCNCQWPRTLAMARSLCELQSELESDPSGSLVTEGTSLDPSQKALAEDFLPKTPAGKESKTKRKRNVERNVCTNLASKFSGNECELQVHDNLKTKIDQVDNCLKQNASAKKDECESYQPINVELHSDPQLLSIEKASKSSNRIGNFPSAAELASLDENFLAKRCNLGYRASRIVKLAKSIVEGKLQLEQLEEVVSSGAVPSLYDKLASQLLEVDGFGPFTCANVLMCLGFYQVIPADSETVRHLKKVHGISCNIQTVQREIVKVYGKYEPFQFLAYWSEIWQFYEEWFGKTSEMPQSDYQLLTASNMRTKNKKPRRPKKI